MPQLYLAAARAQLSPGLPFCSATSGGDISNSSSSLAERVSHATGAARPRISAAALTQKERGGWWDKLCLPRVKHQHSHSALAAHPAKISVLSEDLFLHSISTVNKHSWRKLCQRYCWKMLDQTPWSHFQTPLCSFFTKKKEAVRIYLPSDYYLCVNFYLLFGLVLSFYWDLF